MTKERVRPTFSASRRRMVAAAEWNVATFRSDAHGPSRASRRSGISRGAVLGEGDREDAPGGNPAAEHQVGHASGDDAGLARAGTSQDEKRSLPVEDSFTLEIGRASCRERG